MDWRELLVWVGVGLMVLGSVVTLITALGIVHFKSVFTRMHSSSKPQSFSIALMAIGVTLAMQSVKVACVAFLITFMQYITAPISSHMLGRAAFRSGRAETDTTLVLDEYTQDIQRARIEMVPDPANQSKLAD